MRFDWDPENSVSFTFGKHDMYGCTTIEKSTFLRMLGLTHEFPVTVHRSSGSTHEIDAIKCISAGHRYYQLDLSDLGIGLGARVTLRTCPDAFNELVLLVVDSKSSSNRDAIVDLQHRVNDLYRRIH
jgi:hypothetical protein